MLVLRMLIAAAFSAVAMPASAQSTPAKSPDQMGTAEQRAACRADVRRYCRSVKPEEGEMAYYYCLMAHHEKLRPKCAEVVGAKR